jgi:hypothetical protein
MSLFINVIEDFSHKRERENYYLSLIINRLHKMSIETGIKFVSISTCNKKWINYNLSLYSIDILYIINYGTILVKLSSETT